MRKLIQASLLTLALTAPIYAGDMQQPIAPPDPPTAQGEMQQPIAGEIPYGVTAVWINLLVALIA